MTKANTSCGKKSNARNNQCDMSFNNVVETTEAINDTIPESDTPLPTEKQSKSLPVSDPLQDFSTIHNVTCKLNLFAVFPLFISVLTEVLFYLLKTCYEL